MKRHFYAEILKWKNDPLRKPLILKGARQVGKTTLLLEFGQKEYEDVAYFNFEEKPELKTFFEPNLNPKRIIEELSLYRKKPISQKTFIIFDEIQTCPKALTSLKYFCEETPYNIVAAGSLLGIKLAKPSSFPVGKVDFLKLYPLTFFEFLEAMGEEMMVAKLLNKRDFEPLGEVFHQQLISWYKRYLFIGGMPEVVFNYQQTRDYTLVRKTQANILEAYENDFTKHASKPEAAKLLHLWNSIPLQLGRENKKFKYADVKKGGRAKEFETALHWLKEAGLIHTCFNVSSPGIPLKSYVDSSCFKIYFFDCGLLGASLGLSEKTIIEGNKLFTHYHGAFVENFAAQALKASRIPLFYWTNQSRAEVDFLISKQENIIPQEVKAGVDQHKKSLTIYDEKYHPPFLYRASLRDFKHDGRVKNIPVYALGLTGNF